MKAEQNKVVSLTYELIVDGALADKADENRPLEYIHGTGMLLPKFESEVEGKEPGEEFAFTLTPEEGYGTFDESRLIGLPKEAFMMDGKVRDDLLVIGKMIPMVNDAGQVVNGIVYDVTDECKHHGDNECCHKGKGHHGDGECCHKEDSDCCHKDAE